MRIDVTRSGGIAGLRAQATADLDELPEEEAAELRGLVGEADVAALARRSPVRGGGADRFQYDVKVTREDGEEELSVSEAEAPPALRALVRRVLEREV